MRSRLAILGMLVLGMVLSTGGAGLAVSGFANPKGNAAQSQYGGGGGGGGRPYDPSEEGAEQGGTVKWYDPAKGFGFVVPDEGGQDLFVHRSALARAGLHELHDGQRVTIRVVTGRKGPEVGSIAVAS